MLGRAVARLRDDARVVGLVVGGSRGVADYYSDVDLFVVVEDEAFDEVLAGRDSAVEAVGSPLFAFNVDPATGGRRANSIPGTIAPRSHALPARTRGSVRGAARGDRAVPGTASAGRSALRVGLRSGAGGDAGSGDGPALGHTGGALGGLIEGANRTVYTIVPDTCSLAWRDPDRSFSP